MRQEYNNSSSNSDFNRKRGGSVLNLPSFASENIVGGGQLRSNNYSASSRSWNGGEGNYASLMSSGFAGTETMLNPDHRVGGGGEIHLDSSSKKRRNKVASQKGGKPFSRLASYTRNVEGGGRLICHLLGLMFKPSFIGGVF